MAQRFYAANNFAQAWAAELALPDAEKFSVAGLQLRARLELADNHPALAEADLLQARRLAMHDRTTLLLLGQAFWRDDRFADAAPFLEQVDQIAAARVAQQLAGRAAYRVEGLGVEDRIRLIRTAPLPVVAVRLNSGDVCYFVVDLAAAEVTIDPGVAAKLELPALGAAAGEWAAAGAGSASQGFAGATRSILPALAIGLWTVHDLPVLVRSTAGYQQMLDAAAAAGAAGAAVPAGAAPSAALQSATAGAASGLPRLTIDGAIGLEMLAQFATTVDLAAAELQLRRRPGVPGAESDQARRQRLLAQGAAPHKMHWPADGELLAEYGPASATDEAHPVTTALLAAHRTTLDFGNMLLWVEK